MFRARVSLLHGLIAAGLVCVRPAPGEAAVLRVPDPYSTIASAIAAADDGDTVLVGSGTYARRVAVDRPLTILAEADDVRLLGLTGSSARVVGFRFDATLSGGAETMVVAGAGLELADCRFSGSGAGLEIVAGATGVRVAATSFTGQVPAIRIPAPAGETRIEDVTLTDCPFGIVAGDTASCPASFPPCDGVACPLVALDRVVVTGGERPVVAGGGVRLVLTDCRVENAPVALRAVGARLEVIGGTFVGADSHSRGFVLDATGGAVHGARFDRFALACDLGDAGCAAPTTVVLGGSLADGNTFLNNTVQLRVRQGDPVDADFNHWGSLDCADVAARIEGQAPGFIADALFLTAVNCATPVETTGWGAIKARFGGSGGR